MPSDPVPVADASRRPADDNAGFRSAVAAAQACIDGANAQLASVLDPVAGLAWTDDDHPVLMASRVVAADAGIEISAPPHASATWSNAVYLRELARTSRCRIRRVRLEGGWQRQDGGPLLAFRKGDGAPVAAVPQGPRRYRLVDPARHATVELTAAVAAELEDEAYVFYRPLPQRAVDAWQLLKFSLRGMQGDLLMVALMGMASAVLGLLTPIAIGILYNVVIPQENRPQLLQLMVILLLAAFCSALFNLTRNMALLRMGGRMDYTVQAAVWDHLLKLPVAFFKQYSAGDLALRADAVSLIRQQLSSSVVTSILGAIFSVFSFALLFYYSAELALLAAVIVLFSSALTIALGYGQLKYKRPMYDLQGSLSGMALQFFGGLAKLQVAGAEERALARWAAGYSQSKLLALKSRTFVNVQATVNAVLPPAAIGLVYYWVAIRGHLQVSPGELMAFISAFASLNAAIQGLSTNLVSILNVIPLYQRAGPILNARPENDGSRREPQQLQGAVEVGHVSFRYGTSGPHVLADVSFSVAPGEFVALVGASGAGKSTIFRLLLGFEQPESGAILYDQHDLAAMDPQAVRRQIGVVLQDGKLIPGDILSNIVGTADLTEEDAWEAARMAGFDADIHAMPMGMHTFVSEGGGSFSGGQMQRLLIARAIAKKPRILLFDEATSALDNETQAIVSRSLDELQATRIVIAHRLSTIRHADRILVLENGRIRQTGTFDELMGQPGPFAELARRQIA